MAFDNISIYFFYNIFKILSHYKYRVAKKCKGEGTIKNRQFRGKPYCTEDTKGRINYFMAELSY